MSKTRIANHTQNRIHSRSAEHKRNRNFAKFKVKSPEKDRFFTYDPRFLEEEFEPELEGDETPPAELPEDELNHDLEDGDFEITDDDRPPAKIAEPFPADRELPGFPGKPGLAITDSPLLDLNRVYALVINYYQGKFQCRFSEPNWMRGARIRTSTSLEAKKSFFRISQFLKAVALWLEKEKQLFLQNPTPENFVSGESAEPDNCIVLQKGFLTRISNYPPQPERNRADKMDQPSFSRLKNKIWLFWPQQSMPLDAIFTESHDKIFTKAWILEGGRAAYREAVEEKFTDILEEAPDFDNLKETTKNSNEDFAILHPHEKLVILCRKTKLLSAIQEIHTELVKELI